MSELPHCFTNPDQWAQRVADRFAEQPAPAALIGDVCDTLLDSRRVWYDYYVAAMLDAGHHPTTLATIEEFEANKWGTYLSHPDVTDDYPALKERLMGDILFHTDMPVVPASSELADLGAAYSVPHGYLSTRPSNLGEVTAADLRRHGFAENPLMLRNPDMPYRDTIQYKRGGLYALRSVLDQQGFENAPVVLVDDFAKLIRTINEEDADRGIVGVHFTEQTSWRTIMQQYLGLHP